MDSKIAGRMGGMIVKKKYGNAHFRKISREYWAKKKEEEKLKEEENGKEKASGS